jgi:hypothetical protein
MDGVATTARSGAAPHNSISAFGARQLGKMAQFVIDEDQFACVMEKFTYKLAGLEPKLDSIITQCSGIKGFAIDGDGQWGPRFRLAVMGGVGSPAGTIFSPLQAYCRAADADPLNVVSRMKIPAAARFARVIWQSRR